MELTILLAKVFGLYLIVGAVAIWYRRRYIMPMLGNFAHEPVMRLIVGSIELIAGLFLVASHNLWISAPTFLISLFGWMLVLEGIFYMIASDKTVTGMYKKLNRPWWYAFGALFSLIVGAYLALYGFGYLS